MILYTAPNRRTKKWKKTSLNWAELLARLAVPTKTGETMREYKAMSVSEKAQKKDQGGFVGGTLKQGQRRKGCVLSRSLITLDADRASLVDWENFTALYPDIRCCVYSTHSHTTENPRLRWIFPLDREVDPEEYEAIARKTAEWIGLETMDPSTYQPERMMYWPSIPSDGEYFFRMQDGEDLSADAVLGEYTDWRDTRSWPISSNENEIIRTEVKKAGDPTEKKGMVGLFCRCYDIPAAIDAFIPEVYEECGDPNRRTYTGGSSAAGAVIYEDGNFLYSHHAHDPCGGQLVNAFDMVRLHNFGHLDTLSDKSKPITQQPSYQKMCEFASTLVEIKRIRAQEAMEDLSGGEEIGDERWLEQLSVNPKTGAVEKTINNVVLILQNDPGLKGKIGYNLLRGRICRTGDLPWKAVMDKKNGDDWNDADDAHLRIWLEKHWRLRDEGAVASALTAVADDHTFHPVKSYLDGLEWDGVPRVETLLVDYLGAEDTELNRAFSRKWMAAAVKRVLQPGCKFDYCLTLIGGQGIGKSTLAQKLSRGYFTDTLTKIGSKESYEALRGVWICEIAEMTATKKADVEAVKQYISKQEDTYRPAYGRHPQTYKRQSVFIATTNDPEPLRDTTGNRRWWIVPCGRKTSCMENIQALDDPTIDQLWAEAKTLLEKGEKLWLDDPALASEAEELQKNHVLQDEWEGIVDEYLNRLIPENWDQMEEYEKQRWANGDLGEPDGTRKRKQISLIELRKELKEVLGVSAEANAKNDGTNRRLTAILNNLPGWRREKVRKRIPGYGMQTVFTRIE